MTRRKGREMDKKDKNTVEEDLRQEAKSAAQEENAENVAEELFDRVGVRFVTQNRFDTLRVIRFLLEKNIVTVLK